MNAPNLPASPFDWLRKLPQSVSLEWLSLALKLAQHLRVLICTMPRESYEILDYDATVELLDFQGKRARFSKRQRVRFLQDHIIAFEDFLWGDGEILADYRCSPGVVVDKYREGDCWNVLISLRATKSAGDTEEFYIEWAMKNAFLKREEWLQTEIRRHTRRLRMSVVLPKKRRCHRALLMQRSINRTTELGPEHFHTLPDGRQLVSWETKDVRGYELYTLKWHW